jgi:hypothetical protein
MSASHEEVLQVVALIATCLSMRPPLVAYTEGSMAKEVGNGNATHVVMYLPTSSPHATPMNTFPCSQHTKKMN